MSADSKEAEWNYLQVSILACIRPEGCVILTASSFTFE